MRKNTQKNLILLSLGLIFIFIIGNDRNFSNYSLIYSKDIDENIITNEPKTSDYLELDPFIIRDGGIGPSDYTWAGAASQPWCSGGGTKNNPYIISNIIINGQNQELSCIRIATSTVFFKIKDCIFYNSRHVGYAGIMLSHVLNGEILNNKCFSNTVGIRIEDSDNINITNNTITDNEYGIMTFDSSQVDILFNNASNNDYGSGIRASNGDSYNISGNIANNNHYGLSVSNSNNILMENNYAKANYYGVGIYSTFYSVVLNNTILNSYTGIDFMHSDNNVISACDIQNNSYGGGLDMYESFNNNFTFNKFSYNNPAIHLSSCDSNTFEQNTLISNENLAEGGAAIALFQSSYNQFIRNTLRDHSTGISLSYQSNNNTFLKNNLFNNRVCVRWDTSCLGNVFIDNVCGYEMPTILGYNLFLLLGILSIVAFIIYTKNKKSREFIA